MPQGEARRLVAVLADRAGFQTADDRRALLSMAGLETVARSTDLQGAAVEVARRVVHGLGDGDLGRLIESLVHADLDPDEADFVRLLLDRYAFGAGHGETSEAAGADDGSQRPPLVATSLEIGADSEAAGGRGRSSGSRRTARSGQLLSCSVVVSLALVAVVFLPGRLALWGGGTAVGPSEIVTDAADCRWLGDPELAGDGGTRVALSYRLAPTADGRAVELELLWTAEELELGGTPGDTRFETDKSIRVWSIDDDCPGGRIDQIRGVDLKASREVVFDPRQYGFQSFPDTGSLVDIRVRFDSEDGVDYREQALTASLSGLRVTTTGCE